METMKVVESGPEDQNILVETAWKARLGRLGKGGTRSGTTNDAEASVRSLRHLEVDIKPN